jgi:hypothetical protein
MAIGLRTKTICLKIGHTHSRKNLKPLVAKKELKKQRKLITIDILLFLNNILTDNYLN